MLSKNTIFSHSTYRDTNKLALSFHKSDLERLSTILKNIRNADFLALELKTDIDILQRAITECEKNPYFIFDIVQYVEGKSEYGNELYQRIGGYLKLIYEFDSTDFSSLSEIKNYLQTNSIETIETAGVNNESEDTYDFAFIMNEASEKTRKSLLREGITVTNASLSLGNNFINSERSGLKFGIYNKNALLHKGEKREIQIFRDHPDTISGLNSELSISALIDLLQLLEDIQNSEMLSVSLHKDTITLRESIKEKTQGIYMLFEVSDDSSKRVEINSDGEKLNSYGIELYYKDGGILLPVLASDTEIDGVGEKGVPNIDDVIKYLKSKEIKRVYTGELDGTTLGLEKQTEIMDMNWCPTPEEDGEYISREMLDEDIFDKLGEEGIFVEIINPVSIDECHRRIDKGFVKIITDSFDPEDVSRELDRIEDARDIVLLKDRELLTEILKQKLEGAYFLFDIDDTWASAEYTPDDGEGTGLYQVQNGEMIAIYDQTDQYTPTQENDIEEYIEDFNSKNPGKKIEKIYTGDFGRNALGSPENQILFGLQSITIDKGTGDDDETDIVTIESSNLKEIGGIKLTNINLLHLTEKIGD